ncbi:hypothetical protein MCOR31_010209 [Pyricularia oryzae]|nr:hypothetical protein MCOR30_005844 [Pyricularia oryzae]KAI6342707.1 hypothetical protein MCOR28_005222 [Pyricularia oryzae]KAI6357674.1 hypothetical protein MCOR31_010209 [Pyricularia oryzae]KAI6428957.1 hypothetical protein MCOR21_005256 [Pyricularia oryzae]
MSHQNKMTHAELQHQLRKLSREFSRDAFGTFFSGALALFMPWLCGSAVFSFAGLVSKIFKLRDLVKDIKARLFTTIVTLGHDDLMVATGRFIQSLKQGVDWLKYHASIEVPHVQALSAAKVGELDKHYRMSHPTIKGIAEGVSKPVEKTQELLGLDTAKVLASPGTGQGWHADGTKVVEQVLVAGAVQVATEKIVDAVTQKPYDACVDRRHKK